jgi:hypothetical protein
MQAQRAVLHDKHVDVVVATPGRLLDFRQRQDVDFSKVEILVIDEADRMLDMGFIPDMRRIVYGCPPKDRRQTMLFSATLTPEVTRLATQWMHDPVTVNVENEHVAAETIDQRVYIVTGEQKFTIVYNILRTMEPERVIIFGNRRDSTELLCDNLRNQGWTWHCCPAPWSSASAWRCWRTSAAARCRSGRDGRRRARPAHRRHRPDHQLQHPRAGGRLRAPHRPHGPGGGKGHVDHVRRRNRQLLHSGGRGIHEAAAEMRAAPEEWLAPLPKPMLEKKRRPRPAGGGFGGRGGPRGGGRGGGRGGPRRR